MIQMNKATILILLLPMSLLVSCATGSKSKDIQKVETPVAQVDPGEALKQAAEKLDKLADEARKSGPEAVRYLATDLYLKATDASIRGDAQTAVFLYKHVHSLVPDDVYIKKKYAVELIRVGDLESSESLLSDVYKAEKDENVGLILGGVYTALDKTKEARVTYRSVMKDHPKSEEACVFLAKSFALSKDKKEAYKLLDSCEAKIKGKAIFSYFKGKMAVDEGNKKTAMKYFQHSLKVDRNYHQSVIAIGLLHEEKEQYDKAIGVYEKFLKVEPENFPVLSRLVQILFATGKYDQVVRYAEKLSSLDQSDLNLKVRLGILYTDKKRFNDAIGVFKEILEAVPGSDKILYYLGSLYQQIDKFHDAIGYFSKIESASTLFHDSHVQIAQMLQAMAQEKQDQENKFVEFVNEKSKSNDKLKLELGVMLTGYWEGKSQYEKAIVVLDDLKSHEGYTEGHEYYRASLYEKNKQFDDARDIIEKMIEKNPENPHALNFLGYSMLERNEDLEKAYVLIKKAVDLKPEDGFIRDSLGWYYYKVGKLDLALQEIKKAWELVKDDVVITKHLAIIYKEMEKYDEAKKYYMEALKHCKLESEKQDVLKELEDLENVRLPASKDKQDVVKEPRTTDAPSSN
ncbi:MAG: tetratricopeptide repeat protein [Deltaproteobacteria bacterium]|nr:MAG: tetratricopeptide repeat protein [Deltaproteobacteria bacterium]TNF26885.1 MAG: tetratricopeptide repeat protein [Deltaproteobacteria bacterium]